MRERPHGRGLAGASITALAALLLAGTAAGAETIALLVDLDGDAAPVSAVVRLHRAAGAGGPAADRTHEIRAPGTLELELAEGEVWEASVAADGWWSPPVLVSSGVGASIRLVPSSRLRGQLRAPRGERGPEQLALRIGRSGSAQGETYDLDCPVTTDGSFDCAVPAGSAVDLRLRARGFVSHYLWGIELPRGGVRQLGELTLRRGGSIVGWVVVESGRLSPEARATLEPSGGDLGAPVASERPADLARLRLETVPNPHGFFAFEGLEPGSYRLALRQPGAAAVEIAPIQVLENSETRLDDPVVLAPPIDLEAVLDPPRDPYGESWRPRLVRRGRPGHSAPVAPPHETAEAGRWSWSGLARGDYGLLVDDSRGQTFGSAELSLDRGTSPLYVELDVVPVEGEVTLGGEPLWAAVTFRARPGPERIRLESDPDGELFGFLPREGVWSVLVESEDPDVVRRFEEVEVHRTTGQDTARVELRLPGTHLSGEVVSDSGRAVPGATVRADPWPLDALGVSTATDDEGRFELRGLEAGSIQVHAEAEIDGEPHASEPHHLVLDESSRPEVRLVLHRRITVTGRVLNGAGAGLPAAAVQLSPLAGGRALPMQGEIVSTDAAGRFSFSVPAWADRVAIDVMAAGFALRQWVVATGSGPLELVVEPGGGTLELLLPERPIEWLDWSAPAPVAFHHGGGLGLWVNGLVRWAEISGIGEQPPGVFLIPNLPPGRWSVCLVAPRQIALDSLAAIPPSLCRHGELTQLGKLTLEVPEPPAGD